MIKECLPNIFASLLRTQMLFSRSCGGSINSWGANDEIGEENVSMNPERF